jgi:hypothetical protein
MTPQEYDQHIRLLEHELIARRREADRREALRQRARLLAELEKGLPDVPLDKRGFGVMNEPE